MGAFNVDAEPAFEALRGASACAWDVIRPPKDLPPAMSGNAGRNSWAAAAAQRPSYITQVFAKSQFGFTLPFAAAAEVKFAWVCRFAGALVGMTDFPHVTRALGAFLARPAVIAGLEIPKRA